MITLQQTELPLCAAWEALCWHPLPPPRKRNPFDGSSQPSLSPLTVLINKKPFHSGKEEKPHDGRLILLSQPLLLRLQTLDFHFSHLVIGADNVTLLNPHFFSLFCFIDGAFLRTFSSHFQLPDFQKSNL